MKLFISQWYCGHDDTIINSPVEKKKGTKARETIRQYRGYANRILFVNSQVAPCHFRPNVDSLSLSLGSRVVYYLRSCKPKIIVIHDYHVQRRAIPPAHARRSRGMEARNIHKEEEGVRCGPPPELFDLDGCGVCT